VSAPTPEPAAPPPLEMYGALRSVMHQADYGSKVTVGELLAKPGAHGVGALEGLGGEITFLDGAAWLSRPDGDSVTTETLAPGAASDQGIALLALQRVEGWEAREMATGTDLGGLGDVVRSAAADAGFALDQPIPFRVRGALEGLSYHVIDGSKLPPGPSSHDAHQSAGVRIEQSAVEGTLVGVWATGAAGVFTHMGSTTHVHVVIDEPRGSGHVDGVQVAAGATLELPVRDRRR